MRTTRVERNSASLAQGVQVYPLCVSFLFCFTSRYTPSSSQSQRFPLPVQALRTPLRSLHSSYSSITSGVIRRRTVRAASTKCLRWICDDEQSPMSSRVLCASRQVGAYIRSVHVFVHRAESCVLTHRGDLGSGTAVRLSRKIGFVKVSRDILAAGRSSRCHARSLRARRRRHRC